MEGKGWLGIFEAKVNPTDHERRRADTVRVRNPIPYNAAHYGHKLHCDQNEKLSILARNFFHFIQAQNFFQH